MNYRNKVVELARTQLGVCEPSGDDKYLTWFNRNCGCHLPMNAAWCACFVTWCLRNAGVPTSVFGNFAQCSVAVSWAKRKKIWYYKTSGYIPKPGDFVLFDWEGDRRANHIGIVESATTRSLVTIEGNTSGGAPVDGVRRKNYSITSRYIFGYIAVGYESAADEDKSTIETINSRKDQIKDMQKKLNADFAAGLSCDGIWGRLTKKAFIKAMQAEINQSFDGDLTVDGAWGPRTMRAFPNIRYGDKGDMVELIQIIANVRGNKLEVDGIFGNDTKNEIMKIQKQCGLVVDGIVGKNTMEKLV